jgi:hypothetical protein
MGPCVRGDDDNPNIVTQNQLARLARHQFGGRLARRLAACSGCGKTTRRAKFRLTRRANHSYKFARLTRQEGRIAIVTNADGMRWTRQRRARRGVRRAGWRKTCERSNGAQTNGAEAYGKTVWSWHPLLMSSRRRFCRPNRARQTLNPQATVTRTNSSPRRARHKP